LFITIGTNETVGFWECLLLGNFLFALWTNFLVGATLAPTDPVLAATAVQGRFAESHLTENLRQLLSAESGANVRVFNMF
jgi:NhaP-type Na+/H+ or K+/H+ antiporter